jgi:hypothetical protein
MYERFKSSVTLDANDLLSAVMWNADSLHRDRRVRRWVCFSDQHFAVFVHIMFIGFAGFCGQIVLGQVSHFNSNAEICHVVLLWRVQMWRGE